VENYKEVALDSERWKEVCGVAMPKWLLKQKKIKCDKQMYLNNIYK